MTDQLFIRKVKLQAGGQSFEGLRTAFKVTKYLQGKPNDAEIRIWNLSSTSRAALQEKQIPIILSAGYQSNFAQIFSGQTRTVSHVKDKADWISTIHAGDGEVNVRTKRIKTSFAKGTPIQTIVNEIAKTTGFDLGNLSKALTNLPGGQSQSPNGFVAHGPAYKLLQQYLGTLGYTVGIQDNSLSVLQAPVAGRPLEDTQTTAVVVSSTTGMVGSPEIAEKGTDKKQVLKVKSLLQPKFVPGGLIQLQSANLNGLFRIELVEHQGDIFETPFYSHLECKAR